jgi:methyl-accepting chemotaxis protein
MSIPSKQHNATEKEITTILQELVTHSAKSIPRLEELQQELPAAACVVEQAALKLSEQFKTLTTAAQAQRDILQDMTAVKKSFTIDDEKLVLKDFVSLLNKTLNEAIEQILFISKKSMLMVYSMSDAIKNLDKIDRFAKNIQRITMQTNTLAVNAKIEASKVGEIGGGFLVVAGEVYDISTEIEELSEKIHNRIHHIKGTTQTSYKILQEVATIDISDNIVVKQRLNNFMENLLEQSDSFQEMIQSAAMTAGALSETISSMVMELQFQDRNSQICENSVGIISQHGASLKTWLLRLQGYSAQKSTGSLQKYLVQQGVIPQPPKTWFGRRKPTPSAIIPDIPKPPEAENKAMNAAALLHDFQALTQSEGIALQLLTELLPESASTVKASTIKLNQNFQELLAGAVQQGKIIQQMADTAGMLKAGNREVTLQDFTNMLYEMLDYSVEKILFVAKKIMSMLMSMDASIEALKEIQQFTSGIQKITAKTNILAMNATIEAMRAGQDGLSFAVVAKEVRNISLAISSLSLDIDQTIVAISTDVQASHDILKEISSADMTENILVKEKIDGCMHELLQQNIRFKDTMCEAAITSNNIVDSIKDMSVGMDFYRGNTEKIESIAHVLREQSRLLTRLDNAILMIVPQSTPSVEALEQHAQTIAQGIKLGDIKQRYAEKLSQHGINVLASQDASTASAAEDDIELF